MNVQWPMTNAHECIVQTNCVDYSFISSPSSTRAPAHRHRIIIIGVVMLWLYLLVKLPIVIEVNTVIVVQPNDIDVVVSFGQTAQCDGVVATWRHITRCRFESGWFWKKRTCCSWRWVCVCRARGHTIHVDMQNLFESGSDAIVRLAHVISFIGIGGKINRERGVPQRNRFEFFWCFALCVP